MKESFTFHGRQVREDIIESLNAWGTIGRPTGGFLEAVLSNDLEEACARADYTNLWTLPAIVAYVYNELPGMCWGSPARVKEWPELLRKRREERGDNEGNPVQRQGDVA